MSDNSYTISGPRAAIDSNLTAMRFHELALQAWLNRKFQVAAGYPIPVIFAPVLDAYSQFKLLWKGPNNPFAYLFDLKDTNGTPLYEPYPQNIRLPLLSVQRKAWTFRSAQNYSMHPARMYAWATDVDNPTKNDLGYVIQRQRPMAWDFNFQVDMLCLRPDTQALFIEALMAAFWRSGGSELQTWITVPYPDWFGVKYVRMKLDGGINNMTQEAPQEATITEFRTSFNVTVEGYALDADFDTVPTFWKLKLSATNPLNPADLAWVWGGTTLDLRSTEQNAVLDSRSPLPPDSAPIVVSTNTVAYDGMEYTPGVVKTLTSGMFLGPAVILDYDTRKSAISTAGPSPALVVPNTDLVRPLKLGTFTQVRVAILVSLPATGALSGPSLALGLVNSAGFPFGQGATLFAGLVLGVDRRNQTPGTSAFTLVNNSAVPLAYPSAPVPYQSVLVSQRSTLATQTPSSHTPYLGTSAPYIRTPLVVDISIVNPTTFTITPWLPSADVAQFDISNEAFISLIQAATPASPGGIPFANGGTVSMTCSTPSGVLDAINIFWNESSASVPLNVHAIAAVKLQ